MGPNGITRKMKVVLIRHGEPRYDEVAERGYIGQGYDLGKLTERGVMQAINVSSSFRLDDAELIVSSPYTRALQTAAIISRLRNLELTIENDLHEWMPDKTFRSKQDVSKAYDDFMNNEGKDTKKKITDWETYAELKKRTHEALRPYIGKYNKIIVVCHGMVMTTFTHIFDMIEHCGIREVEIDESFFK
jgi:broad specificity phosphatase PhoE